MKARGIDDLTFIDCRVGSPGYYGTDEQRGRRVGNVTCHDARHVRNHWTRGIEGLTVVVDLHAKKVLRVVDEGPVPLPDTVADYDPASVGETRAIPGPMRIEQPLGPGFDFDGGIVDWQNWRFHIRHDQRVGLIVSTVTYRDGGPRPPGALRRLSLGDVRALHGPVVQLVSTQLHRHGRVSATAASPSRC